LSTPNLQVADLDFDNIKSNLINYIRTKPGFTDANFEGSGLSILADVLAYNTYYNAVTANMLVPEMFLETAVKRSTACLHAKRLGYLPKSARAPAAVVNVEVFPNDTPDTLTLGKNAQFSTSINGATLTFVTTTAATTTRINNRYIFNNVSIYEGTLTTFKYEVTDLTTNRFVIPSFDVDTSLLQVRVQKSATNTKTTVFNRYQSIVDVDGETAAYFLKVNEAGFFEVYFGDGVLGQPIEVGNIITLEYVVTNKTSGNGCFAFSFNDSINGYDNITVTTVMAAVGGQDFEDLDSIKFNAQRRVLSQDRAVTAPDYENVIPDIFPCDSVTSWGGERNDPPIYGKVFISIKPLRSTDVLTTVNKNFIKSELLKKKNVVTVIPEIVDPDYTYVVVNSTIYFDQTLTPYSAEAIKSIAADDIYTYLSSTINKFNKELRFSPFVKNIDAIDNSILSNITILRMKKVITPNTGFLTKYQVVFNNPIKPSSNLAQQIQTNAFRISGSNTDYYIDDNNGILRMYSLDGGVKKVVNSNVGSVDYASGKISIDGLTITTSSQITITVNPASPDLFSVRNTILAINKEDITVNAIVEASDVADHITTLTS
jgi:hypothetical protein